MVFKLNISDKGKAWKIESNTETLVGKKIGEELNGSELSENLAGYTLKITGGSDSSGFPHKSDIAGSELKRIIFSKGWGMHKRPRKQGKKVRQTPDGLRLRKTIRGQQISEKTIQINMIVVKHGNKPLNELFPEQNQPKAKKEEAPAQ